jgi:hypothetical protein
MNISQLSIVPLNSLQINSNLEDAKQEFPNGLEINKIRDLALPNTIELEKQKEIENDVSPLLSLPKELLFKIFSCLSIRGLLFVHLASKQGSTLISDWILERKLKPITCSYADDDLPYEQFCSDLSKLQNELSQISNNSNSTENSQRDPKIHCFYKLLQYVGFASEDLKDFFDDPDPCNTQCLSGRVKVVLQESKAFYRLLTILDKNAKGEPTLPNEVINKLFNIFGKPASGKRGRQFFRDIYNLIIKNRDYLHGFVNASSLMKGKPSKSFCVRFSDTADTLSVSYVKQDGKVEHIRLDSLGYGLFRNGQALNSLEEILNCYCKKKIIDAKKSIAGPVNKLDVQVFYY